MDYFRPHLDLAGHLVVHHLRLADVHALQQRDGTCIASVNDPTSQEVGVKFESAIPGFITGIRFYKGAANTGTHVGDLWSSTGTLLATATFTSETATGWQQVSFSNPVAIAADTVYVASYFDPNGDYAADGGYFASSGVTSGPLTALSNGAVAGGNGVFADGGGFPTSSFNATNYWVDVDFTPGTVNTPPPTVTGESPAPAPRGSPPSVPFRQRSARRSSQARSSFTLTDSSGNAVSGSLVYNASANSSTFNPDAPLADLDHVHRDCQRGDRLLRQFVGLARELDVHNVCVAHLYAFQQRIATPANPVGERHAGRRAWGQI